VAEGNLSPALSGEKRTVNSKNTATPEKYRCPIVAPELADIVDDRLRGVVMDYGDAVVLNPFCCLLQRSPTVGREAISEGGLIRFN